VQRGLDGKGVANRMVSVFAEWDQLTQDKAIEAPEAYRQIEAKFGVSEDQVARYRSELLALLTDAQFGT
jgi:hypothetical protein